MMVYAKDLYRGDVLADGTMVDAVFETPDQGRLRVRLHSGETYDWLRRRRVELEAVGREPS